MRVARRSLATRLAALALAAVAGAAAAAAGDPAAEEPVLREAERVQQSLVALVARIRPATVAVVRYLEREENGKSIEVPGGMGSGVIFTRDGRILTNVHVIENASRVEVVLADHRTLPAEVVMEHAKYDFAVLQVKAGNLPAAEFAKTSLVVPGQWAIAAGNPRGLGLDGEPVVTLGIVSGLGRVAGGQFDYLNAIQTDAEINPGNSGGPLFDLDGRIIGINGKIATRDDVVANVGVGFTIPAAQIQAFLAAANKGEPGYSGLVIAGGTHEKGGVVVGSVIPRSPADKVGIRAGDRIVSLNGRGIDNFTTWSNEIALLPNGKTMSLQIVREGNRAITKKLTLQSPAGAR